MGLDVLLSHFTDDPKEIIEKEEKYEELAEEIWDEYPAYDKMTDSEKAEAHRRTKELANEMGLGKYGEDPRKETIEIDSKKHPEHYFKIGYFRSSYNETGINLVLRDSIGMDLYAIFDPPDDYEFLPDWKGARRRAVEVLNTFEDYIKKSPFRAMFVSGNFRSKRIESEKEAIDTLIEARSQESSKKGPLSRGWWSYQQGMIFMSDPPKVLAILKGKDIINNDGCYVVYEDHEMGEYVKALEIVIETIDYVLTQPDPDRWYLRWSS